MDFNDLIVFKASYMALLLPAFPNTFKRAFICLKGLLILWGP